MRALLASLGIWCSLAQATDILFIGNSFTYGEGSPVKNWHANSVHDLNAQGIGGMPALFKAFTRQAGLEYDVSLETQGGVGLDWHLRNRANVIDQRPWDVVVMHGYSTLDESKPGDPAKLINSAKHVTALLANRNPLIDVRLLATWPRADQTYESKGAWYGKSIEAMGRDVRAGYDQAAAAVPIVKGVIPVGDAWLRAMANGVADSNPYDRVKSNKINLWAKDHYHASSYGYYLAALMVFGAITGHDPRSLGKSECAAFELGLSAARVTALQQVAFDELVSQGIIKNSARKTRLSVKSMDCVN